MQQLNDFLLVIDDRERAVFPHLTTDAQSIRYEKRRIEAGDYAIINTKKNQLIAIFERKTLDDFGASFKDNRHNNKQKMINVREKTGCRVFYIIEGPQSPNLTTRYARIPFRHIESSIFHMMLRDNIMFIYTRHTQDTVAKLVRFMTSCSTLKNELVNDDSSKQLGGNPDETPDNLLTQRTSKSDLDVAREMWCTFKFVSTSSVDTFVQNFTIKDIIDKKYSKEYLTNFRSKDKTRINTRAVNSLTYITKLQEVKLLSVIPGVSRVTAVEILKHTNSLKQLLSYPAEVISFIKVGKTQKKLGNHRANAIVKYFRYKYTPTEIKDGSPCRSDGES